MENDQTLDTLEREVAEYRREAHAILERAGDTDLRDADAAEFDRLTTGIEERAQLIATLRDRQARADLVRAVQSGRMRTEGGATGMHTVHGDAPGYAGDQDRAPQTRDLDGQRLAFTTTMAEVAAERMLTDHGMGQRALATSGAVVVGQEFEPDPILLGRPVPSLIAALPTRQHATPQFSYLQQSARDNQAAIVSEGSAKPESVLTVVRVEDSLDVVAHISEAIPRYWLLDNPSLAQFVATELRFGLQVAVEEMVLDTINDTENIGSQEYDTSALVTIRKSLTALEVAGHEPGVFVLSPTDWEAVELLIATTNAVEYQGIPFDPAARRLWGVPVVISTAQASGVTHTLARGAVAIDTDTRGIQIDWSETSTADDWAKNLIRCRVEGRFAASVFQPLGVVVGDLGLSS